MDEKEKKSKEYANTFELFNDKEAWIVKCEKEAEMKAWLSAIEAVQKTRSGPVFG